MMAVAAAAFSVAGAGDAAVGAANGPILFVGSRAQNFHAEIYSVGADGAGRTNLTRNQSADQWPAVSPDGRQIAFVSRRDGFDTVYVMNTGGSSQPRRVGGPFNTVTAPAWSPSGRALAFTVRTPQMSFFDSSQHYVVDLASGRVRALASQDICGADGVAFSPDGRFVAYQMGQCRESPAHVRVVRADGGRAQGAGGGAFAGWAPRGRRLLLLLSSTRKANVWNLATVDPSGRRRWVLRGVPASAAAWSPNGRLIAFVRPGRRPGVYVIRPGGRGPRRLLALANARSIAWSPDGARLALTAARARRDLGLATYLVGSNGQGLRRVADSRSLPIWSRDSRRLAFIGMDGAARVVSPLASSDLPVTDAAVDAKLLQIAWAGDRLVFASGSPNSTHLFAVEQDRTGLRQITPDGAPAGRISPDGSRVAFARDGDIWTARLDGSDQRQLTSAAERNAQAPSVQDAQPAWSPDGRRLAFVRGIGGQGAILVGDIFVVDSSSGPAQQVTNVKNDGVSASGPAWSPDGAWIAFTGTGLFAVRPDGSGLHRIVSTANLAAYREPAWSPDGLKLALGGSAIAVVNVDGSGYQPLTGPGRAREGQPAWSPDGTKIVFVRAADPDGARGEPEDSDLWTLNLDGSGEARLTDGRWPDVLPAWMPLRP